MTRFLDIARNLRSTKDLYKRLCFSYAVAATLWLVVLDWALARALEEPVLLWLIPLKNALFVVLSAIGLWDFASRFLRKRWQDEEEIVRMQERLRLLSEASQDAIWLTVWDQNAKRFRIEYANPSLAEVWGRSIEDIDKAQHVFSEWIHDDDTSLAKQKVESFFAGTAGRSLDIEFRLLRPDGSIRWLWTKAEMVFGKRGEPLRVAGVTRDLSAKKQAELALVDSERLFKSLFNSSHDAIARCDMDGSVVDGNEAFHELTGYGRKELHDLKLPSLTPESVERDEDSEAREQVASRGFSDLYEQEFRRKDGSVVPVSVRLSVFRDCEGRAAGMFGIVRDVSAEKRQYDEVLRAKEEAESARDAQNRFLTVVSHELRTPLNPIIGYTDLLLSREQETMQQEFLSIIRNSALGMSGLISDILDFARIESGESELESTPFRITELLDSVVQQFAPVARLNENRLEARYEWKNCAVVGDKEKIRLVLSNLVSNACKFTKKGEIVLRCSYLGAAGDVARFRFSVEDNGIGIAESEQARIFQPFRQAEQSPGLGAGLGLTVAEKLVSTMGGSISVESKLGDGSVFSVDLPLPIEAMEAEPPRRDIGEMLGEGRTRDVLVVEDDATNLKFATDMLDHFGCNVAIARNGEESLELLQKRRFDLVLMDVTMPVMDGCEATSRLRLSEGPNKNVPVIAMTANVTRKAEVDCLRSGMNGFVTKPVSLAEFRDVLGKWLEA